MAQSPENRPATSHDEPLPASPPDSVAPPAFTSSELASPDLTSTSPDLVPPPADKQSRYKVPHTRTSAAWFGIWAGVAALILLIIFVAQNTAKVQVDFLWLSGRFSLAVALLVAGVGGAIVAMAFAAARILQLRRLVKRGH